MESCIELSGYYQNYPQNQTHLCSVSIRQKGYVTHLCLTLGSGSIFSSHGTSAIDTGGGNCQNLSDDVSFSISVTNGSISSF